jgi:hypothetical protein
VLLLSNEIGKSCPLLTVPLLMCMLLGTSCRREVASVCVCVSK